MASIVTIQNTQLVLKNFSGEKGRYFNSSGNPEFACVIPPELAELMTADGWNVKQFKPKPEDTNEPDFFIKIKIGVNGRPPRMKMITSAGQKDISVEDCQVFDYVRIAKVDLTLSPYEYEFQGKTGISAYLNSLFVTVEEDELDRKYANIPEVGTGGYNIPDEDVPF